jgi:hypothetical protein
MSLERLGLGKDRIKESVGQALRTSRDSLARM